MTRTLEVVQLVLIGLLAGEELIVRYGVQPALDSLPDEAHLRARIALVKRLKVVVPIMMVPAVLASVALVVVAGNAHGFGWGIAGLVALVAFLAFSFFGTVPINIRVNDWDSGNPPADWRQVVHRWETIDTFRSSAAILAFILFAVAVGLQVP
jgi:4-hydroxybenzoate polyprenyltransferase